MSVATLAWHLLRGGLWEVAGLCSRSRAPTSLQPLWAQMVASLPPPPHSETFPQEWHDAHPEETGSRGPRPGDHVHVRACTPTTPTDRRQVLVGEPRRHWASAREGNTGRQAGAQTSPGGGLAILLLVQGQKNRKPGLGGGRETGGHLQHRPAPRGGRLQQQETQLSSRGATVGSTVESWEATAFKNK